MAKVVLHLSSGCIERLGQVAPSNLSQDPHNLQQCNGEDQVEQSRIFGAADFPSTMAAKEQTESSSQPYLITHMLKCSDSSDTLLLFFGASATFMCFYANFWHFTIAVMPIMVLKMMLIC